MSGVFIDTSALYAVLDRDDEHHPAASTIWRRLLEGSESLVTTNYVLVESYALVQSRLGMPALRTLRNDVLPVVDIHWITADDHHRAVDALIVADRRGLSLVDCSSFVAMRGLAVRRAFAFDDDFLQQGFEVLARPS